MEKRNYVESSALIGQEDDKGRFLVRVIREGQGSSAYYSGEMLRENGHALNGVLSFENHPVNPDKPWERSFKEIVGEIDGDVWFEQDEDGRGALWAYYKPSPEYIETFRRYGSKIGLSIFTQGESEYNKDAGYVEAKTFDPNYPFKSVDVVVAAGAGGGFDSYLESFREAVSDDPDVHPGQDNNRKELVMDKEIEDAFKALTDNLSDLTQAVAKITAEAPEGSEIEVQVEAELIAEAEKRGREAAIAAQKELVGADLSASQVAAIESAIVEGQDVAPLIESAKAIAQELRAEQAPPGRVFDESAKPVRKERTAIKNWGK